MSGNVRRWNGWGVEGEGARLPSAAAAWLEARLGAGDAVASVAEEAIAIPPAKTLPRFGSPLSSERATRLRNACGQSFCDLIALRSARVAGFPDAVLFPSTATALAADLAIAAREGVRVIVRGGGTSVVGGVSVSDSARPTVVLSLERMRGMTELDARSRLATFLGGTQGPEVDGALAPHGLRLGHEPQSYELSTVGGWVATRSAGQRSTGVGKIDDLVAGLEVATPAGVWSLPPLPASAAGPELRRLVIGSEGRLGVVTAATLRVRPLPRREEGTTVLFSTWEEGLEACRTLLQDGVGIEVLRLSDATETSFGASLLELPAVARALSRFVLGRRRFQNACALLLGWTGTGEEVAAASARAAQVWRTFGGMAVGGSGWRRWRAERFRHPYLRDALLDRGWGVDTLETAATWSRLPDVYAAVRTALDGAAAAMSLRIAVLCHLSHGYRDGASLYFTFLWPLRGGAERDQWSALKRAATEGLLRAGGTLSHHHGVGTMHAPYLAREVGEAGMRLLRAAAGALDPGGALNPGIFGLEAPGAAGDVEGEDGR